MALNVHPRLHDFCVAVVSIYTNDTARSVPQFLNEVCAVHACALPLMARPGIHHCPWSLVPLPEVGPRLCLHAAPGQLGVTLAVCTLRHGATLCVGMSHLTERGTAGHSYKKILEGT